MIPKIIHNIWIEGYENLPNENKINYLNIKKKNPDWEFLIWDDEMIKKLLQKYPSISDMYNKNTYTVFDKDSIKSHIARYIIMKEYGGLYFDIDFNCTSSFDNLFSNENNNSDTNKTIFISKSAVNYWNYIYSLQKTKYSSGFMAVDKNHPIWNKVIEKLKHATTKYDIINAVDISLQQIENNHKTSETSFPIVILDKVNSDYYQCENNETICYKSVPSSHIMFGSVFKYITCYHKQILLFILAVIIIICVEYLYMHNSRTFGVVNFIPGLPGSAPPSQPILQKKKGNKPKQ
jgi:hypothetical protein